MVIFVIDQKRISNFSQNTRSDHIAYSLRALRYYNALVFSNAALQKNVYIMLKMVWLVLFKTIKHSAAIAAIQSSICIRKYLVLCVQLKRTFRLACIRIREQPLLRVDGCAISHKITHDKATYLGTSIFSTCMLEHHTYA